METPAPAPAYLAHAFPVSVKGVAVQDGKVLFLENERDEWELPGGKLELGEDPPDCVVREISEETGWQVTAGPLLNCWQYHICPGSDVVIVTYGCYVRSTDPPVISNEHKRAACSPPARCRSWSCRTAISDRCPHGWPASATGSDLFDRDWGWPGAASGAGHRARRRVPRHPVPPVSFPRRRWPRRVRCSPLRPGCRGCPSGSRSVTCCLRNSWPPPPGGPAGRCASPGTSATGNCSRPYCACTATNRKAGHVTAGIIRLRQSPQIDDHPGRRGAGLVLLARAAAESGQAELFDTVTGQCVQALKATAGHEVLFNRFTVREVRLRGLLATGRTGQAVDLAENFAAGDRPPTPQWRVIERITTADVLARAGDEHTAADMLSAALSDAGTLRLPHQVQRIIRLTGQPGVLTGQPVRAQAEAVLTRLDRQLTEATSATGTPPCAGLSGGDR